MACDGNGNQTQFSLVVLLRRLLVRICRALSIVRTIRRHVAVTHIRYLVQFLLFRLFRTQKWEYDSDNTTETILSEMELSNRGWPFRYICLRICVHHSRLLSAELCRNCWKHFHFVLAVFWNIWIRNFSFVILNCKLHCILSIMNCSDVVNRGSNAPPRAASPTVDVYPIANQLRTGVENKMTVLLCIFRFCLINSVGPMRLI